MGCGGGAPRCDPAGDDGKRQHRTLSLKFQAAVDFRPQPIGCGNAGVPQVPQLAILHTLDQIAVMRMCQRHERHMLSVQRYRIYKTHDLSLIILRGWPPANSDRHNGSMTARIIYSTGVGSLCPNCRRPVRDCVCPKGAPGAAKPGAVRVGRETKGRAGKGVTTVTGLPMSLSDVEALATRLKKRCGSGGTVREGVIEIQGDHRDVIVAELIKLGWPAKKSGG